MANLKEIRERIVSVRSTRQITSAMKMVSAARLRKAQQGIIKMRPYAERLQKILHNISGSIDISEGNVFAQTRDIKKVLLILITSNRGLCGSFNERIVKKAVDLAENKYSTQFKKGNVDFYLIGKRAYDLMKSDNYNILTTESQIFNDLTYPHVVPIAESILERFKICEYDRIDIIYNVFKNAAVQNLTVEQFLPIETEEAQEHSLKHDYIFEPSKEFIVEELIPKSLKIQFYKAMLDSFASEHGARMTAMHMATDNATQLIKELRLNYNKARQAAITKEILEIVGGSEAIED